MYAKNASKKHLIFEKWDDNENGQKGPLWKGYSLCKMVSLGEKLKSSKISEKRLFKHNTVVVWKKRLEKNLRFEKWDNNENGEKRPLCMAYSLWKMVSLGQKLKSRKICEKRLFKHNTVVVCKKRLEKTFNIREMRRKGKWEKTAPMHGL